MNDLSVEKLDELKSIVQEEYKSLGKVHCPYLNKEVNFNAKGLDHIKLKEWNKARLISDQYLRFKFLKLAPEIIKKSHTLQEYKEGSSFERVKINSRWESKLFKVCYYGFIAMCKDREVRVKVIVKEIEGRDPFFWSIIPFWKNDNHPLLKKIKKVFCEGNLEND
jgi:hypothetical protein